MMSGRKTLRRWFWAWEFEKEEAWLNAMAREGWLLDGVGFCTYHFIPCEPGSYTLRLEMHDPDADYLAFMEGIGAEYVGRMMRWIYFRRDTAMGPFDLYSDIDSRIGHLDRIGRMMKGAGIANLVIGLGNSLNPVLDIGWINLVCATLLMYGVGRIDGRREALERERLLRE
jgi:hypothetical protein